MHKLRKAAAVAAMVGGIGLATGGVASANGYDDPYPHDVVIDNIQSVDCEQDFDGGTTTLDTGGGDLIGDTEIAQGNFCTVIGSLED